jgi:hypothetical protein
VATTMFRTEHGCCHDPTRNATAAQRATSGAYSFGNITASGEGSMTA